MNNNRQTKLPIACHCNFTNCLKNQPCGVIKMREMRGEVEKKTPEKRDGKSLIFMTSHG